jgi:hypothetical protein
MGKEVTWILRLTSTRGADPRPLPVAFLRIATACRSEPSLIASRPLKGLVRGLARESQTVTAERTDPFNIRTELQSKESHDQSTTAAGGFPLTSHRRRKAEPTELSGVPSRGTTGELIKAIEARIASRISTSPEGQNA